MSDIQLNALSGDIDLTGNKVRLITNSVDATKQRVLIRLKTFNDEWFLNKNAGLPYFQEIFKKGTSLNLIENLFRNQILKTQGVQRITSFTSEFNNTTRRFTLSFTVITPEQEALTITNFEV